jgi:hypothetical protein
MPFPSHANLTAYELIAFLPNSIRCSDVVYRFASNGASRHILWVMINTGRDLQKTWTADQCGSAICKTMGKAGYVGWTLRKHNDWQADKESGWDETTLAVDSFQTTIDQRTQGDPDMVPFKNLAKGVRNMPEGDDALDLTRMVRYAVKFPQETWMYPRDYEKMLKMLGGPALIKREHCDSASFGRREQGLRVRDWGHRYLAESQGKRHQQQKAITEREGDQESVRGSKIWTWVRRKTEQDKKRQHNLRNMTAPQQVMLPLLKIFQHRLQLPSVSPFKQARSILSARTPLEDHVVDRHTGCCTISGSQTQPMSVDGQRT